MRTAILEHAPAAMPDSASSADDWALRLGSASLGMDPVKRVKLDSFGRFEPSFDVVAFAAIGVIMPPGSSEYYGRCHSLWYGDLQEEGMYRWFELGFMVSPLLARRFPHVPAAMDPNEDAGKAFSNALAEICLARPVVAIDQGEEHEFVTRWIEWFGQAAMGELESPRSLPEGEPRGSCR
jgi:serine/threonine-protein kinase